MANPYFKFKQFTIQQDRCAMKVTTDACLFGAWCAEEIKKTVPPFSHLLDIGTGTGLLSLMVAQKNPTVAISAVEIDAAAYQQATENIARTNVGNNTQIYEADIKNWKAPQKFQTIISNPPFYQKSLKAATYEKNLALHSTALKLEEVVTIIQANLQPGGCFYLLLPYERLQNLINYANQQGLSLHKIVRVQQSIQHNYFRVMVKGGLQQKETIVEETIVITDEEKQYTSEFTQLLKDYYLYS